jgi:hypothetical protein
MRKPRVLLLVLLGLAAGTPLRADTPAARATIRDCAQRAAPDLVGMEDLGPACPKLAAAIEELGLSAHLPSDWKEDVAAGDLTDWGALVDRYDVSAPPVLLADSSRLQTIARALQAPPESLSWWQRLKAWMSHWLEPEQRQWPDWLRWPTRWRPGKPLLYSVIALVLIGAAALVVMELRAAGVVGANRRRRAPPGRAVTGTSAHAARWSDAEPVDEPFEGLRSERLLRVLVAALTRSHRLEHDRDLTCRELIAAARFDTAAQREVFASVALRAEQVLYGDPRRAPILSDQELGRSARGLYGELLAAPAGQPPR